MTRQYPNVGAMAGIRSIAAARFDPTLPLPPATSGIGYRSGICSHDGIGPSSGKTDPIPYRAFKRRSEVSDHPAVT